VIFITSQCAEIKLLNINVHFLIMLLNLVHVLTCLCYYCYGNVTVNLIFNVCKELITIRDLHQPMNDDSSKQTTTLVIKMVIGRIVLGICERFKLPTLVDNIA
jgi:hypothetical protein